MNQTIRRWAPWLALVIVFALATTALSWWQFARREERVHKIELVQQNYEASPIPLNQLSWENDQYGNYAAEWQSVVISGHYLPELSVLVRNRPLSGSPGFLQLVPFQLQDGSVLVIERGWLPAGTDITEPQSNPLPVEDFKKLIVRLRPGEQALNKPSVAGQVASIDLLEIAGRNSELDIEDRFYGRLVQETPAAETAPIPMPKPSLSEGNHLSYALQWLLFGIMAFGAFIWAYRNDRQQRLVAQGLATVKVRRKTQADEDAAFEDVSQ